MSERAALLFYTLRMAQQAAGRSKRRADRFLDTARAIAAELIGYGCEKRTVQLDSGAWVCGRCGFVGFWYGRHCGPFAEPDNQEDPA